MHLFVIYYILYILGINKYIYKFKHKYEIEIRNILRIHNYTQLSIYFVHS